MVLITVPPGNAVAHSTRMKIGNWIWRAAAVLATLLAVVLLLRVLQSERQPDLKPWHTWAPPEAGASDIDGLDWAGWLAAEARLMDVTRAHLRESLEPEDRVPANRYFDGSPLNSGRFTRDWNRSYEL